MSKFPHQNEPNFKLWRETQVNEPYYPKVSAPLPLTKNEQKIRMSLMGPIIPLGFLALHRFGFNLTKTGFPAFLYKHIDKNKISETKVKNASYMYTCIAASCVQLYSNFKCGKNLKNPNRRDIANIQLYPKYDFKDYGILTGIALAVRLI